MTSHDYEGLAERLEACWEDLTREAAEAIRLLVAERDRLEEALNRIADPRNIHFAGDAQVVARAALSGRKEP